MFECQHSNTPMKLILRNIARALPLCVNTDPTCTSSFDNQILNWISSRYNITNQTPFSDTPAVFPFSIHKEAYRKCICHVTSIVQFSNVQFCLTGFQKYRFTPFLWCPLMPMRYIPVTKKMLDIFLFRQQICKDVLHWTEVRSHGLVKLQGNYRTSSQERRLVISLKFVHQRMKTSLTTCMKWLKHIATIWSQHLLRYGLRMSKISSGTPCHQTSQSLMYSYWDPLY